MHVNGSFILDSSRRYLWSADTMDKNKKWNMNLAEAIGSSYAAFLIHFQDNYIDPKGTTNKEALLKSIDQYYNVFPTWLRKYPMFPPPAEPICLHIAKMVYKRLEGENAPVLVQIKTLSSTEVHKVIYLPLIDKKAPQNQAYFWNERQQGELGKSKEGELKAVLSRIGMQLTLAPLRILYHLLDVSESDLSLCEVTGNVTFQYYKNRSRLYGHRIGSYKGRRTGAYSTGPVGPAYRHSNCGSKI